MHPIIFQTGFFNLTTLTFFTAIAIFAATFAIIKLSSINSLKIQFLSENFLMIVIVSLIGGRIAGILTNYQFYFAEIEKHGFWQIFKIWDEGFSPIAAIATGLIYLYFVCKRQQQDFFKWLDSISPALLIAFAISHIGHFFNGSRYGSPTSLPWGVNFENPIIKYTVPIHPTQMYSFTFSILILIAIYYLSKHPKVSNSKPGLISLIIISLYSFFRFLEEFARGDDTVLILSLRLPQIVAFLTFAISSYFLFKRIKTLKSNSTN